MIEKPFIRNQSSAVLALILVVHITDECNLEIVYLYSKHDRNPRARS